MKDELLRVYLYRYMARMDDVLEYDYQQLLENIRFRSVDTLDYLDLITALVRKQMADEIFKNVYQILAITGQK